ncbi:hypothetical protein DENSPDRAFT_707839 [Dentipellis sp. KUC8613]|nr:hypothetical protein DENSPDRAFT_707839 [Dentipellis sp. KUC8613]
MSITCLVPCLQSTTTPQLSYSNLFPLPNQLPPIASDLGKISPRTSTVLGPARVPSASHSPSRTPCHSRPLLLRKTLENAGYPSRRRNLFHQVCRIATPTGPTFPSAVAARGPVARPVRLPAAVHACAPLHLLCPAGAAIHGPCAVLSCGRLRPFLDALGARKWVYREASQPQQFSRRATIHHPHPHPPSTHISSTHTPRRARSPDLQYRYTPVPPGSQPTAHCPTDGTRSPVHMRTAPKANPISSITVLMPCCVAPSFPHAHTHPRRQLHLHIPLIWSLHHASQLARVHIHVHMQPAHPFLLPPRTSHRRTYLSIYPHPCFVSITHLSPARL